MINEYKSLTIRPPVIDGRPINIRKFYDRNSQLSPQIAALGKLIATYLLKKIPDLQGIRKVRDRVHNTSKLFGKYAYRYTSNDVCVVCKLFSFFRTSRNTIQFKAGIHSSSERESNSWPECFNRTRTHFNLQITEVPQWSRLSMKYIRSRMRPLLWKLIPYKINVQFRHLSLLSICFPLASLHTKSGIRMRLE